MTDLEIAAIVNEVRGCRDVGRADTAALATVKLLAEILKEIKGLRDDVEYRLNNRVGRPSP